MFTNKVVLVTGASKGIGSGIAIGFAQKGADVVVNYHHDSDGADSVVKQITKLGRKAVALQADVGKADDAQFLISTALQTFGKIDILINNAGIAIWKPFLELTEADWDMTINTNLKSIFLISRLAAKSMIENGAGVIVNISSIAGHGSMECLAPYSASKGGMTLLTKAMAVELAPYKIRVNSLAPGTIDIKRNRETDPNYPDNWLPYIPAGRVGEIRDIVDPVLFLCSEAAAYITGETIYADGGLTQYVPMPRADFVGLVKKDECHE
jgi:NAD(P)-dependent dehydrogenase (short-subunit alcohol dehydrogenase family)